MSLRASLGQLRATHDRREIGRGRSAGNAQCKHTFATARVYCAMVSWLFRQGARGVTYAAARDNQLWADEGSSSLFLGGFRTRTVAHGAKMKKIGDEKFAETNGSEEPFAWGVPSTRDTLSVQGAHQWDRLS